MHLSLTDANVRCFHFRVHRKNPMILLPDNRVFHTSMVRHGPTICKKNNNKLAPHYFFKYLCHVKKVCRIFSFSLSKTTRINKKKVPCKWRISIKIKQKLTNPGRSSIFNSSILYEINMSCELYFVLANNSRGIYKF